METKSENRVLHIKFAISSYLSCKIENVYEYDLKSSLDKVNPTIGATLITTDVHIINYYCDLLYPPDFKRRQDRLNEHIDLILKSSSYDQGMSLMPALTDPGQIRPTLCDLLVEKALPIFIREMEMANLVCQSSGGYDLIVNAQMCKLKLNLMNGTSKIVEFQFKELFKFI
jgi:hypothetical protein